MIVLCIYNVFMQQKPTATETIGIYVTCKIQISIANQCNLLFFCKKYKKCNCLKNIKILHFILLQKDWNLLNNKLKISLFKCHKRYITCYSLKSENKQNSKGVQYLIRLFTVYDTVTVMNIGCWMVIFSDRIFMFSGLHHYYQILFSYSWLCHLYYQY